ncbi:MAG: hypothetical protein RSF67_09130, partial [Clostridia bacterium]
KIGLMYASDYTLSLGETAKSMTTDTNTNAATLKTGWMHQSNNDITKSEYEWTLSLYGVSGSRYGAWTVDSTGCVNSSFVYSTLAGRPVFYLRSETTHSGGSGTYADPIIIG